MNTSPAKNILWEISQALGHECQALTSPLDGHTEGIRLGKITYYLGDDAGEDGLGPLDGYTWAVYETAEDGVTELVQDGWDDWIDVQAVAQMLRLANAN